MKHMYSEEELLEVAKIENLLDSKGRNRFIEIEGTPGEIEGLQIYYGKCVLNGNNLIFEISGLFNKDMSADFTLYKFTLPEWIAQKIPLGFANVVDLSSYGIISTTGGLFSSSFTIYKEGNDIKFWQASPIDAQTPKLFRIRYNLIISK